MIKVSDRDEDLDLRVLSDFVRTHGEEVRWCLFDMKYSGDRFRGLTPRDIERHSKSGVRFDSDEFVEFLDTINQVIEGAFVARKADCQEGRERDRTETNAVIKVLICDGAFWEVGGVLAMDFIAKTQLSIVSDSEP